MDKINPPDREAEKALTIGMAEKNIPKAFKGKCFARGPFEVEFVPNVEANLLLEIFKERALCYFCQFYFAQIISCRSCKRTECGCCYLKCKDVLPNCPNCLNPYTDAEWEDMEKEKTINTLMVKCPIDDDCSKFPLMDLREHLRLSHPNKTTNIFRKLAPELDLETHEKELAAHEFSKKQSEPHQIVQQAPENIAGSSFTDFERASLKLQSRNMEYEKQKEIDIVIKSDMDVNQKKIQLSNRGLDPDVISVLLSVNLGREEEEACGSAFSASTGKTIDQTASSSRNTQSSQNMSVSDDKSKMSGATSFQFNGSNSSKRCSSFSTGDNYLKDPISFNHSDKRMLKAIFNLTRRFSSFDLGNIAFLYQMPGRDYLSFIHLLIDLLNLDQCPSSLSDFHSALNNSGLSYLGIVISESIKKDEDYVPSCSRIEEILDIPISSLSEMFVKNKSDKTNCFMDRLKSTVERVPERFVWLPLFEAFCDNNKRMRFYGDVSQKYCNPEIVLWEMERTGKSIRPIFDVLYYSGHLTTVTRLEDLIHPVKCKPKCAPASGLRPFIFSR